MGVQQSIYTAKIPSRARPKWVQTEKPPLSDLCPLPPAADNNATSVISGKRLIYSYPSQSDCMPWRDWNETSAPPISASGRERWRTVGRLTLRLGASLSDAAGALDLA